MRVIRRVAQQTRVLLLRWPPAHSPAPCIRQKFCPQQLSGFTTMGITRLERVWDATCPRMWDSWETDGVKWVIRDLRPEDDEEAIKLLIETMPADETLSVLNDMANDPISIQCMGDCWRNYLAHRTSLGCYEEKDGKSKLVGLNVLLTIFEGQERRDLVEGKAWKNLFGALKLCDDKLNAFKLLGVDKVLYGLGLVVHKDYRGYGLGRRILSAREHLALHLGVPATSTVFTGPASQKSAERSGFSTALTVTLKELAEAGLDFPRDDKRCIKLMVQKYQRK